MSHIVANLPPVKCFVRKEFLYDFEKGHGEFESDSKWALGDTNTVMYEE
jgi:hypothetical protein